MALMLPGTEVWQLKSSVGALIGVEIGGSNGMINVE